MSWTMGNESYDVEKVKTKYNWKSNLNVSFMETKNYKNQQEKQQTIQIFHT